MENEKIKVEKVMPIIMNRRQFMQLSALGILVLLAEKFGLKSEAATPSDEVLYASLVDAFADGCASTQDNIYGIQVPLGNVEQFAFTHNGKKFIYNYYSQCVKNKKRGSWSRFYKDEKQRAVLDQCEAFLHHLSVYPKDNEQAKNFLKYVANKFLIKTYKEEILSDVAEFDSYYINQVVLCETVFEMLQVASEKVPAIKYWYSNSKPEDIWEELKKEDNNDSEKVIAQKSGMCGQVIVDMCCGRSDHSDRNISSRRSGITKGNTQWLELIRLNAFAPNDEIQKMVLRSVYGVYTKDQVCDDLDITGAKYDQFMRECGLTQTNGIDTESNGYSMTRKLK